MGFIFDWSAIAIAGFSFGGFSRLLPFHLTFGVTSLTDREVYLKPEVDDTAGLLREFMMIFLSTVIVFSSYPPYIPSTHNTKNKKKYTLYDKSMIPTYYVWIHSFSHSSKTLKFSLCFVLLQRPPLRNMYYYNKDDFECQ